MQSFFTTPYSTQRLQQTAGKSAYVAYISGKGFLSQRDEKFGQINTLQYGEGFQLFVGADKDIVATDKIIIDGEHYEASGIKMRKMGSILFKAIALNKKKI
jgi:hypothetical protein